MSVTGGLWSAECQLQHSSQSNAPPHKRNASPRTTHAKKQPRSNKPKTHLLISGSAAACASRSAAVRGATSKPDRETFSSFGAPAGAGFQLPLELPAPIPSSFLPNNPPRRPPKTAATWMAARRCAARGRRGAAARAAAGLAAAVEVRDLWWVGGAWGLAGRGERRGCSMRVGTRKALATGSCGVRAAAPRPAPPRHADSDTIACHPIYGFFTAVCPYLSACIEGSVSSVSVTGESWVSWTMSASTHGAMGSGKLTGGVKLRTNAFTTEEPDTHHETGEKAVWTGPPPPTLLPHITEPSPRPAILHIYP